MSKCPKLGDLDSLDKSVGQVVCQYLRDHGRDPSEWYNFIMHRDKKSENILDEAKRITEDVRQKEYGDANDVYSFVGELWTSYLGGGQILTASTVCMMMILLKVGRQSFKNKADNLVDIAGYASLIHKMEECK